MNFQETPLYYAISSQTDIQKLIPLKESIQISKKELYHRFYTQGIQSLALEELYEKYREDVKLYESLSLNLQNSYSTIEQLKSHEKSFHTLSYLVYIHLFQQK